MQYHYAWFIWSLLLIAIWAAVYLALRSKESKREMLTVSLWTSLFGLTEPIFVPAYWSPPSLFDLALRTGFDIESLIFAFGVGGIGVVIYEALFKTKHAPLSVGERHQHRHRAHLVALLSAPAIFALFYAFSGLNPMYSVLIALVGSGLITWYCRPDLKKKMLVSALLFFGMYFVYFLTLIAMYPGYVEQVWNLKDLSGILIVGIPLEELLFALGGGFFWSSVNEHLTWRKLSH